MTTENSSPESVQTSTAMESSGSTGDTQHTASEASETTSSAESNATSPNQPSMAGQEAANPPWQPNYKFKAFDKEGEIDPLFRPLIKDAETEKAVRKFHEKAFALEPMKADRDRWKGEFETYKKSTEPSLRAMTQLNKLLQNKDYDNFFNGIGLDEKEVFEWVQKRLNILQMPADQRAEFERQQQIRLQNYQLEYQNQEVMQQYQQQAVQAREMQLASVLSRPDVSSYAQKWDQVAGQIGAFRNLIIEEAQAYHLRNQVDLSVEEAVNLVMQKFGKVIQTPNGPVVTPQAEAASQPGVPAQAQSAPQQKPPIIPNVAGRGTSPVKKSPKSLEDLKALAKQL